MPAPDNEAILIEIEKAENYIRNLMRTLLDLNATPHTLCCVAELLRHISHCYDNPNPFSHEITAGAARVMGVAVNRNTTAEIREIEIPDELKEKIIAAIKEYTDNSED